MPTQISLTLTTCSLNCDAQANVILNDPCYKVDHLMLIYSKTFLNIKSHKTSPYILHAIDIFLSINSSFNNFFCSTNVSLGRDVEAL